MRDGRDAGLLALDDSVWGGPLYAGQARGNGTFAPDSHAVSGGFAVTGVVSRFGGGVAGVATGASEGRTVAYQYSRRIARGAACAGTAAQGHEADCDDHGRKTFGTDV